MPRIEWKRPLASVTLGVDLVDSDSGVSTVGDTPRDSFMGTSQAGICEYAGRSPVLRPLPAQLH
jgi:hypothetical protein